MVPPPKVDLGGASIYIYIGFGGDLEILKSLEGFLGQPTGWVRANLFFFCNKHAYLLSPAKTFPL